MLEESIALLQGAAGAQLLKIGVELAEQLFGLGFPRARNGLKDGAAFEIELPLGAFAAGFDAVPAPRSEVVAGAFQPVLQVPEIGLINGQGIAQDRSRVGDCIPRGQGGQSGCWRQQSQTKAQDQGQQLRDQSARHGCPFSSGDHRTIRLYPFAGNDLQQRLPHWHHD